MSSEAAYALQQVLVAAARDSSQRPRALTALRGSQVWAATWPTDPATMRTLTNSDGVTALPVFSSERQLEDAAARYAWLGVDGSLPMRRLHISEAIRLAKLYRARMVVVDLAADHALELDEGEMELLSSLPSTRPPSFAGQAPVVSRLTPHEGIAVPRASVVSRLTPHEGFEAVRTSSQPPSAAPSRTPSQRPSQSPLRPSVVTTDRGQHSVSATFGASSTALLSQLEHGFPDALLDELSHVLREFPEVEWACVVDADRGTGAPVPSVALRIEPAFQKNLPTIHQKLQRASASFGQVFEVLTLETPEQMKEARSMGLPFYPWRKKP